MRMKFEKIHKRPFLPIVTERLLLRPVCMEDAEQITKLLQNFNVSKTLARVPFPYELEDAVNFISIKQQEVKEGKDSLVLTILNRSSGQLLGAIGYEEESIGYWLGEAFWGQGIMKEAFHAFVHFLFYVCDISEFKISPLRTNQASVRLIEGIGCKFSHQEQLYFTAARQTQEVNFYTLSQKDYRNTYESKQIPILWISAASLIHDKKLLIAQRPQSRTMSGVWEFPGGKIESGETPEEALKRELHEELDIDVDVHDLIPLTFCSYRYENFHAVIFLFEVKKWNGEIRGKESQHLAWVKYQELVRYPARGASVELFHKIYENLDSQDLWD